MDFFVGILGGVIVHTIVHVSQPQQGGAKRTRSGREYGRSPAGRRRKSSAGRRRKSRGGVQTRSMAKRRREDDSPSPEKRQKIQQIQQIEDDRCGEFCTDEPCFALRNADCDGKEDPITMVNIPMDQGYCLNARCYDRETLMQIRRTTRREPFARKSFLVLDDLDRAFRNAAENGDTALVERLLAAGADVNAKGGRGRRARGAVTALMNAAANGHADVVELLIDAGADLNLQEPGLREEGCDLSECYGRTALLFAVERDHADIVKLLVEAGADVNVRRKDNYGDTALIQAVEDRGYNIVKQLLAAPNIDVNMKSKGIERYSWSKNREFSALVAAVRNNKPDIVELLLDNGADVNTKDGKHITVLDSAAANGYTDVVELLLDKGARVNKKSGIRGSTALISAAVEGYPAIVKLLIDAGADVNAQNGIGFTALMFAIRNGHIDIVKQLLAAPGIDVNVQDEDDKTALDWAAESNDAVIVDLLTEAQKRAAERAQAPSRTTAEVGTQTAANGPYVEKLLEEIRKLQNQIARPTAAQ